MEKIKVTRKTTESEMNVVLDFAPLKKDYRTFCSGSEDHG